MNLKAIADAQFGFGEVMHTHICSTKAAQVHFSKPNRLFMFCPGFDAHAGYNSSNTGYYFNANAGNLQNKI